MEEKEKVEGDGSPIIRVRLRDVTWIPDNERKKCTLCKKAFTIFFRKHHCRLCGEVVCQDCSNHKVLLKTNKTLVRTCDKCYTIARKHYNKIKKSTSSRNNSNAHSRQRQRGSGQAGDGRNAAEAGRATHSADPSNSGRETQSQGSIIGGRGNNKKGVGRNRNNQDFAVDEAGNLIDERGWGKTFRIVNTLVYYIMLLMWFSFLSQFVFVLLQNPSSTWESVLEKAVERLQSVKNILGLLCGVGLYAIIRMYSNRGMLGGNQEQEEKQEFLMYNKETKSD